MAKKNINNKAINSFITGQYWQSTNIGHKPYSCDVEYARIATGLFNVILNNIEYFPKEYNKNNAAELAICATGYLEDVVSELGIFATFRRLCKKLYGKNIPFFNYGENYDEKDINFEDLQFILWCHLSDFTYDQKALINPDNKALALISAAIYDYLWDEYEKAPINTEKLKAITDTSISNDFISLKYRLLWLIDSCYLTQSKKLLQEIEEEAIELSQKLDMSLSLARYTILSDRAVSRQLKPLALTAPQFFSELLKTLNKSELADAIGQVHGKEIDLYKNKCHDDSTITLIDKEGEKYIVDLYSLNEDNLNNILSLKIYLTQIAYFNGKWHINGTLSGFNEEEPYNYNCTKIAKIKENQERTYKVLLAKFNCKRLHYLPSVKSLEERLNCTSETNISIDRSLDLDTQNAPLLAFLNKNGELSINFDNVSCVNDLENPYYNPKTSVQKSLEIIFNEDAVSAECRAYLQKNGLLKDASFSSASNPEIGHALMQDNLDFLIRFFNSNSYISPDSL